jgi:hypothetical protein
MEQQREVAQLLIKEISEQPGHAKLVFCALDATDEDQWKEVGAPVLIC